MLTGTGSGADECALHGVVELVLKLQYAALEPVADALVIHFEVVVEAVHLTRPASDQEHK